ncbi:MAG: DUF2089 family protein [Bacteriovoracaceae bacterium]|nr:DUF2089 family protein [Bacteriovoracaceae bacterium]
MNKISLNIKCPSCRKELVPKVLGCESCGIKIEGNFASNEFSVLDLEEIHFLRIFILTEGRIRDMEKVLGISYPTVKTKLLALKRKLGLETENVMDMLSSFEEGKIDYMALKNKLTRKGETND